MMFPIVTLAVGLFLGVPDGASTEVCFGAYVPTKIAIRRLGGIDEPLTWHDIDWQCSVQFPGFEMLKKDFTKLTPRERDLCGDEPVPLGVQMNRGNGGPYWRGAYDIEHENAVTEEYLKYKKPMVGKENNSVEWRGALNLQSSEWWMVPTDTRFTCALCQRARRLLLNRLDNRRVRPKPYSRAYTMYVNNFDYSTKEYFVNFVQETFDKAKAKIVVDKKSTFLADGQAKFFMRIRSAKELVLKDFQDLFPAFNISSWWDKDVCRPFTTPLLNSTEAKIGSVVSRQLGLRYISRDCIAEVREGGDVEEDYDAVWDQLLEWFRLTRKCPTGVELHAFENREKRLDAVKYNLTADS